MRKYLSALKARQAEITRGRTLKVLLTSLALLTIGYIVLAFVGW